ncbi:hypothetical protein RDWZM_005731 [Blomia tropicalis]|uniref:Uncharacterized protein n=1 Tax=Blomia tropicalis TaxID=40697 RepID=A0A9Q0M6J3_BLOTA|nr:hypothetical protein RDWZM_005731 [Blomia tropicalis]
MPKIMVPPKYKFITKGEESRLTEQTILKIFSNKKNASLWNSYKPLKSHHIYSSPLFDLKYLPFSLDLIEKYSLDEIVNYERNPIDGRINSIRVRWNPTWLWDISTRGMMEVKIAYWGYVRDPNDLRDPCPPEDGIQHQVRRILMHKFLRKGQKNHCAYLVEWAIETVTVDAFKSKNYEIFRNIIIEFLRNNFKKIMTKSDQLLWFDKVIFEVPQINILPKCFHDENMKKIDSAQKKLYKQFKLNNYQKKKLLKLDNLPNEVLREILCHVLLVKSWPINVPEFNIAYKKLALVSQKIRNISNDICKIHVRSILINFGSGMRRIYHGKHGNNGNTELTQGDVLLNYPKNSPGKCLTYNEARNFADRFQFIEQLIICDNRRNCYDKNFDRLYQGIIRLLTAICGRLKALKLVYDHSELDAIYENQMLNCIGLKQRNLIRLELPGKIWDASIECDPTKMLQPILPQLECFSFNYRINLWNTDQLEHLIETVGNKTADCSQISLAFQTNHLMYDLFEVARRNSSWNRVTSLKLFHKNNFEFDRCLGTWLGAYSNICRLTLEQLDDLPLSLRVIRNIPCDLPNLTELILNGFEPIHQLSENVYEHQIQINDDNNIDDPVDFNMVDLDSDEDEIMDIDDDGGYRENFRLHELIFNIEDDEEIDEEENAPRSFYQLPSIKYLTIKTSFKDTFLLPESDGGRELIHIIWKTFPNICRLEITIEDINTRFPNQKNLKQYHDSLKEFVYKYFERPMETLVINFCKISL